MSVLIKNLDMPTSCQNCFAADDESRYCKAANEYIPFLGHPKFCPLVPVPRHGDLIEESNVWIPNTANAEMRKEGFFTSSHVCGIVQKDEIQDEDYRKDGGQDDV